MEFVEDHDRQNDDDDDGAERVTDEAAAETEASSATEAKSGDGVTSEAVKLPPVTRVDVTALELDNFKSFERKTTIPFREGFTTISGRNGSGKSNLIDSLLFVLNLSSSKGMRADRLTDLFNAHSKKKYARVALKLKVWRGDESAEVEVARKVRRTKSGYTAHYEINGNVKKASELAEFLLELGLSASGMNIVLQGDVTSLTKMSPLNRRRVLDDVAGVSEFDKRIGAARDELTQASRHMEDIELILAELETRLAALKDERETALEYRRLMEKKKALEEDLLILEGQKARDEVLKLERQLGDLRKRKESLEEEQRKSLELLETRRAELEKAEEAYREKGEGERLVAFRKREDLRGELSGISEKTRAAREEIEQIELRAKKRQEEIDELGGKARGLAEKEAELEEKLEDLGRRHDELTNDVSKAMSEIRRQGAAQADKFEELNQLQVVVSANRRREKELGLRVAELAEREAKLATEQELLEKTVGEQNGRREQIARGEAEASTLRRGAREDVAKEEDRGRRLVSRLQAVRDQRDKALDELTDSERRLARAEERINSARIYTDSHAMRLIKGSGIEGIHGTVRELSKFEGKHAAAIEACAGGRLNWVVVEDDRVAAKCIQLLKRQRAGRLTFAPLNKIRPPRVNYTPVGGAGIVGYALDLIEYDQGYDKVMTYVFGDTLVVDDLQTGRKKLGQFRMVTLDGDLLEKRGLMTGGQKPKSAAAAANLAKAEAEADELRKTIEIMTRRRRALAREEQELEAEIKTIRSALEKLQERATETGTRALRAKEELEEIDKYLQPALARLEEVQGEYGSVTTELATLRSERETLLETLSKDEARLTALTEGGDTQHFEELSTQTAKKEMELRDIETTMTATRDRFNTIVSERRELKARQDAAALAIEEGGTRREELEARIATLSEQETEAKGKLAELDKELGKIATELKALDEARKDAQRKAQEAEARSDRLEEEVEAAGLALTGAGEKVERSKEAFAEREAEIKAAGLELPEAPEDGYEEGEDPATLAKNAAATLKRTGAKMESMLPVNMLAIDQFDELSERRTELKDRYEELTGEKEDLLKRMADLEEAKRATFMTAFEAVRTGFRGAFEELAHGDGELWLENEEDPFEGGLIIEARPRGKNFTRLEAMSGGEKSLTALAFIFALQSVNPAPFYIFDEVDQSLDGANTELLAAAIKARSARTQYFVVSHHQAMLNESDQLLGVSMRKGKGTRVTGITLRDEMPAGAA